jgi:hypothetical protein
MTLAPTNEAIRRENHAENNLNKEKKYCNDLGGHARCKDSIIIKSARFCESRRKRNRTYGPDIFAFNL